MRERGRSRENGFELLTKEELRRAIFYLVEGSILERDKFVELSAPGTKRELMEKWNRDGPMSKLDLQRVLRIVRELHSRHGHD